MKISVDLPGETHEYESVGEFEEAAGSIEWPKLHDLSIYVGLSSSKGSDTGTIGASSMPTASRGFRSCFRASLGPVGRGWMEQTLELSRRSSAIRSGAPF